MGGDPAPCVAEDPNLRVGGQLAVESPELCLHLLPNTFEELLRPQGIRVPAQLGLFGGDSLPVDAKHLGRDPGEEVARQLECPDALELGELFVDALHADGPPGSDLRTCRAAMEGSRGAVLRRAGASRSSRRALVAGDSRRATAAQNRSS
jgi:hypothetical protein